MTYTTEIPIHCGFCGKGLLWSLASGYNWFTGQPLAQVICPDRPSVSPDVHDMWRQRNTPDNSDRWERE